MTRNAGEFFRRNSALEADASNPSFHVLAVDDSLVDRKVIEQLLKISSCRVTAVESGRRALQYLGLEGEESSVRFEGLKVNLIMTDYSMPGMTGYELLKKIKGSSTLREIPVVVMSSENILPRINRCLEEGAEEFLLKPVKLSDVRRLKDFVLRGQEQGQGEGNGVTGSQKRKLQDNYLPPSPSLPSALSPSSHTCDHSSTSSSPPSLQSPSKRPRLCSLD
ncbi:hypothetical protein NMG60_11009547 [Bertholletia excelsa]